jgi:hypothetical protein
MGDNHITATVRWSGTEHSSVPFSVQPPVPATSVIPTTYRSQLVPKILSPDVSSYHCYSPVMYAIKHHCEIRSVVQQCLELLDGFFL